ncbi:MAG TPA: hypothetical protein VL625_05485 [Patescibacteria group bacterium]|jgi:hypothetical protein|nr:hypothetical protein [Patescibacteria group bacterium]
MKQQRPYELAIERTLFRDAVLMQLAARFSDMSAGTSCHRKNEDDDIEDELDAAAADEDNDRSLLAGVFNDPVTRRQREVLTAALVREQQLVGQLRQKFAGWSAGSRKPCPKHDDRAYRPSAYTMDMLGLRNIPVPTMMLN